MGRIKRQEGDALAPFFSLERRGEGRRRGRCGRKGGREGEEKGGRRRER